MTNLEKQWVKESEKKRKTLKFKLQYTGWVIACMRQCGIIKTWKCTQYGLDEMC